MWDQKYVKRPRHIYGLFFGRAVYVGQSVNLVRRRGEHRRAWPKRFTFVKLDTVRGTFADAEVAEQAWRCLAHNQGYAILAHAGDLTVRVNPHRRRTGKVQVYLDRCRWPRKLRRWHTWWAQVLAWGMGAGVAWLAWHGAEDAWHRVWGHWPW
jgi:hypothetical protein